MQTVTVQIRIFPSHPALMREHGEAYILAVNQLTVQAERAGSFPKLTSKDIEVKLPSAVRNQVIRDARSIHKKTNKQGKRPTLRRRAYYVNNQNYSIDGNIVAFPVMMDGKVQRLRVASHMTERENNILASGKLGLLKIVEKLGKWYIQISVEIQTGQTNGDAKMGIDVGLKVPAVVVTSTGKTRFVGNGRQNKYIRRKHRSRRRVMGKLKKLSAIRHP